MGGIRIPWWLQAHNIGLQHGYQPECHADSAFGAISYKAFLQQLVAVFELDHSQLDFMMHGNNPASSKQDYTERFKDLLARLSSKISTPTVIVVKVEANTAGHLLEDGPHTDLASTPEAQADALVHGHRMVRALQLFEAWGSGLFERLGGLHGAVEVVFVPSGVLENDSSHSLHYDAVKKAVDKQHTKLDTWLPDPTRLFPPDTLSPIIIQKVQAILQEMPKGKPVLVPATNDYDSLIYSLVWGVDLFILLMGSLWLGAQKSRFFLVKQVLAEAGLVDPVQALCFKAATQCDCMEGGRSACGSAEYDSLAERFKAAVQGGFTVQRAVDASGLSTTTARRGFLYGIGTDLAMPIALRLEGLSNVSLSAEDDNLFDGYGLPGIPAGRRGLQELEDCNALQSLHDLSTHLNFTGNGLLMSTGISATAAFQAGLGKPPLPPTSHQLALEAVLEQQLKVGGSLDPRFAMARQVHAILQAQGAMCAREVLLIAREREWAARRNISQVLNGLQDHLPAGVRFYTAIVSVRGRGVAQQTDTVWVALSQQQLVDVQQQAKVAERGMAQERALLVLEQVGPALEQSESGALPIHQVLGQEQQDHFTQDCTRRSVNYTDAFFGTLKEHGVVVSKARVQIPSNSSWQDSFVVVTSQEAVTVLQQQNEARFQQYTAERQAKLQTVADEITQQLEQSGIGVVSLSSLSSVLADISSTINLSSQLKCLTDIAAANMLPNAVLFKCGNDLMLARSLLCANHLLQAQGQATVAHGLHPLPGDPVAAAAAAAAQAVASSEGVRTRSRSASPDPAAAAHAVDLHPAGQLLTRNGSSSRATGGRAAGLPPPAKQRRNDDADAVAAAADVVSSDADAGDPPRLALGKKVMKSLSSLPLRAVPAKMLAHTGFVTTRSTNVPRQLTQLQEALRAESISPFVFRPGGAGSKPVVVALDDAVMKATYDQALKMMSRHQVI